MQTGENEQDLRKILDFTRLASVLILLFHFYYYCYQAFRAWKWTAPISDKIMANIAQTGLFHHFHTSKLIALVFLAVSLLGGPGRKSEKITYRLITVYLSAGLILYFISASLFYLPTDITPVALSYMLVTITGYLLILAGGTLLTRIIHVKLDQDIFNELNQTFPQEEIKHENPYSINLPTEYNLKGKIRKGWISFPNPMRGLLIAGSPGSGKSYYIVNELIRQFLAKKFTMMVYDFKFPDLSVITYNHFLKNGKKFKVEPTFYLINFDDLTRCHRCNPLDPAGMEDISDALEAARTILLGLNREWIKKQGDFFVESPINLLAAIIWFLRMYHDGQYCTLPHSIELLSQDLETLLTILSTEPTIQALVSPFISAFKSHTMEQLEGQVDGTKIGLGRLASPTIYYVMSGSDFSLDMNNPKAPKVICLANSPMKQDIYGAVLSLYITRLTKLINRKNQLPSSLIFDEFPTLTLNFSSISTLVATARSNLVATAIQDFSQLKAAYGRDQAEVVMNIMGNIIAGQVGGDTAKQLSDRFGRINQDRQSLTINSNDTSINKSMQLDSAVPPSTISQLSAGEFVGIMADSPDQPIKRKLIHSKIINDHKALAEESRLNQDIPVFAAIPPGFVMNVYESIKEDVQNMVDEIMEAIVGDPQVVIEKDPGNSSSGSSASPNP
jgi:hypothetical protein